MSMLVVMLLIEAITRLYAWFTDASAAGALRDALAVMPSYLLLISFILLMAAAWSILRRKSLIDHIGYIIAATLLLDHLLSQADTYSAIIGYPAGVSVMGYSVALIAYGITPLALCFMPFVAMGRQVR